MKRPSEDLGCEVANVGELPAARFLELLALVWICLARKMRWDIAIKRVRR